MRSRVFRFEFGCAAGAWWIFVGRASVRLESDQAVVSTIELRGGGLKAGIPVTTAEKVPKVPMWIVELALLRPYMFVVIALMQNSFMWEYKNELSYFFPSECAAGTHL